MLSFENSFTFSKQSLPDLRYQNAVRSLYFNGFSPHAEIFLFIINPENSHGIRLMIQRHKMTLIREEISCLRIIPADGQDTNLLQHTSLIVNFEDPHGVVPCIGTEYVFPVFGKTEHAGRAYLRMVFASGVYGLYQLKYRPTVI